MRGLTPKAEPQRICTLTEWAKEKNLLKQTKEERQRGTMGYKVNKDKKQSNIPEEAGKRVRSTDEGADLEEKGESTPSKIRVMLELQE